MKQLNQDHKIQTKMYLAIVSVLFVVCAKALDDNLISENSLAVPTAIPLTTPTTTTNSLISSVSVNATTVFSAPTTTTTTTTSTTTQAPSTTTEATVISCTCGVFLSGQFKKGSKQQPKGNPALLHEQSDVFPCNNSGNKMCTNKCLDVIVKHLPNSPAILCGSVDRDVHKERAYLFVKNCKDEWVNTNLSAGREYCCKDGHPYKCPLIR